MNLEGANGKNPVYHVGKLYNIAAQRLAQRLYEATDGHAEVHFVSTTGQRLDPAVADPGPAVLPGGRG
ncbi:hypothetical protein GCM10023238_06060 [Streptomyces heliomycini]